MALPDRIGLSMSITKIILQPRRARPFYARHPWVFAASISRMEGPDGAPARPEPGDEVAVYSHEGAFIARGLFNPNSLIRARLYRWEDAPLDDHFWRGCIDSAVRLRRDVLRLDAPGHAFRLIYSESDGLSGLTVDRYDRWLVTQFTSLALYRNRRTILQTLAETSGVEGIAVRIEHGVAGLEGLDREPPPDNPAHGSIPDGPIEILEHGIRYLVDLRAGQKSGFFLDQRENRRVASNFSEGRRVLDLFCYTGGFALNTLVHGGATHALGIDSSAPAIDLARRNAVANGCGRARFEVADVGSTLARLRESGERFGMVICDPPKFARTARDLDDALRGYARLNQAVLEVLEPNGILFTCSCSGHVDRQVFAEVLGRVVQASGRSIQILDQRGQAADHPVSASCLETDYLKCFVCRVR